MLISAIKTNTLLDYPGKVATIIFTLGCNFRCGFCHNPEFVLPEEVRKNRDDCIAEASFFKFLETRKDFLDGVVICGGEPTIQGDLPEFAKRIKDMGFLVKLDTNGSRPEVLKNLLWSKLVDYVAMDIKAPIEKYSDISGIPHDSEKYRESISMLLESGIEYEFRTTVIKGWHDDDEMLAMARDIKGARSYYLQNYRSDHTLDPNFQGSGFSAEELKHLRDIAAAYVQECKIRL